MDAVERREMLVGFPPPTRRRRCWFYLRRQQGKRERDGAGSREGIRGTPVDWSDWKWPEHNSSYCIFFPPATINFGGGGCNATTAHGVEIITEKRGVTRFIQNCLGSLSVLKVNRFQPRILKLFPSIAGSSLIVRTVFFHWLLCEPESFPVFRFSSVVCCATPLPLLCFSQFLLSVSNVGILVDFCFRRSPLRPTCLHPQNSGFAAGLKLIFEESTIYFGLPGFFGMDLDMTALGDEEVIFKPVYELNLLKKETYYHINDCIHKSSKITVTEDTPQPIFTCTLGMIFAYLVPKVCISLIARAETLELHLQFAELEMQVFDTCNTCSILRSVKKYPSTYSYVVAGLSCLGILLLLLFSSWVNSMKDQAPDPVVIPVVLKMAEFDHIEN
ncbi:hypothetical protein LXL04_019374 [Taraxacum kok-saghyz]